MTIHIHLHNRILDYNRYPQLQIRNIKSQEEIENFLYNDSEIASPFEIKDMDKAVIRIKKALDNDIEQALDKALN